MLGNSNIVQLLLSAGANNSISDENGATPLLYAALHNKSVSILIRIFLYTCLYFGKAKKFYFL